VSSEERPSRPRPATPVTWGLVAANVVVFALETAWGGSQSGPTLYRMGAILGRGALLSEPWRIVSSAFLHIGPVHLLLNMWALVAFGRLLERVWGPRRYLVFYALCAASGGLISALVHSRTLAAGASGAVWGLMTGEIAFLVRLRRQGDPRVQGSLARIAQPLIINFLYSLTPGIDMSAHLGGGVAGWILSGLIKPWSPEGAGWRKAAWGAGLGMAGCVALAIAHGRPWELRSPPRRVPQSMRVGPEPIESSDRLVRDWRPT